MAKNIFIHICRKLILEINVSRVYYPFYRSELIGQK